jgi:hypothetical protein
MIRSFVWPIQVCTGIALALVTLTAAIPTGAQTPSVRGANRDRDYYYPHSRDSYRSEPVIRGNIEDSTIVRPVIIDSDIDSSTIVNPVIVSPRRSIDYDTGYSSRRSYHLVPRTETRTDAACMAFTQLRVACQ